jgi:hypothetical protein
VVELAKHHRARAIELAEVFLRTDLLQRMRRDDTQDFWKGLLLSFGVDRVLSALDQLDRADAGLGLLDAVLEVAPSALFERELWPDLTRPILIRSAEGRVAPSSAFWGLAWMSPPGEGRLAGLTRLPPGAWLDELITQSRSWPEPDRVKLLRHLAGFAIHPGTRGRCIEALLAGGTAPPGGAP